MRRRRAISEPLSVSWDQVPDAPQSLTAEGHLRSIVLDLGGADRGRRRESATGFTGGRRSQALFEQAAPELVTAGSFIDSRIEAGRDYCYVVRAVLNAKTLEIEGPASPESCARSASEESPAP